MRAAALALLASSALAAPVTEKTPATQAARAASPGTVNFLFSHHFSLAGSKVLNSPTFTLEIGAARWLSFGLRYATSSDVANRVNELEPHAILTFLRQEEGRLLDVGAVAAFNLGASSGDLALVAGRSFGPISLAANLRGFSSGYGSTGATLAGGAGVRLRLTGFLFAVGDVNGILAARSREQLGTLDRIGWTGGIAFGIPYSPHTMSLYATNINTHTLQGSSRGTETLRIGFEFDIPLTSLGRWLSIFAPPKRAEAKPPAEPVGGAVEVRIRDYKFFPAQLTVRKGTTVRFLNEDPVPHTATADDGSFDSGLFRQGESWSHRFDAPGSFPYFCAVHPYMRAEVRVED